MKTNECSNEKKNTKSRDKEWVINFQRGNDWNVNFLSRFSLSLVLLNEAIIVHSQRIFVDISHGIIENSDRLLNMETAWILSNVSNY